VYDYGACKYKLRFCDKPKRVSVHGELKWAIWAVPASSRSSAGNHVRADVSSAPVSLEILLFIQARKRSLGCRERFCSRADRLPTEVRIS